MKVKLYQFEVEKLVNIKIDRNTKLVMYWLCAYSYRQYTHSVLNASSCFHSIATNVS